jgi:hypothetical protein
MAAKFAASLSTLVVNTCLLSFGAEWTLYEQVAVAAMDCQRLDVAKVNFFCNLCQSFRTLSDSSSCSLNL